MSTLTIWSNISYKPRKDFIMAISKDKKLELVNELSELLASAKGIAFASYNGTTVAELQELRRDARQNDVVIRVFKNRLVQVSMKQSDTFKGLDTSNLSGQLLYAFSDNDEVLSAKTLNDFAKSHPSLVIAGGFSGEGLAQSAEDTVALASLPSKDRLIAEVVAQLLSPVHDVTNALSGNLHALLDGVADKATA